MRIVFDMAFDQQVAVGDLQVSSSSLGQLFIGLSGLLHVLETQLGMTGKEIHHAMRIQKYQDTMKGLLSETDASFFQASFQHDAWSSAKQLLSWRDELAMAGWAGESSADCTPRLQALALVEQALPMEVKGSLGDRLKQVLSVLESVQVQSIQHIAHQEPMSTLPPLLQRLFATLKSQGIHSTYQPIEPALAAGNLGVVQQSMCGNQTTAQVKADDCSLLLLQAADEWSAANTLAAWLKADNTANKDVLLIQGQGSDVLDGALRQSGLPQIGNQQRSPWRAALQVLPLALANAWSPLNIQALLSFLSLPSSPVPAFAARLLRTAIQNEPGIGGKAWKEAEAAIIETRTQRNLDANMDKEDATAEAETLVKDLNHYLTELRFDAQQGIPPKAFIALCNWVKVGLKKPGLEKSMAQAIAQVDSMIALVTSNSEPIPKAQVERMLDAVIAEGGQNPNNARQAAPWQTVADAGGIAATVDTIIWWGFTDQGQPKLTFWSAKERRTLDDLGIRLESSQNIRAREARQWKRAISLAGKQLILIYPKRVQGAKTQLHPLWDEIRFFAVNPDDASAEKEAKHACLMVNADQFNQQQSVSFAQRQLTLSAEQRYTLPSVATELHIKPESIDSPASLSYSQMSTMLGCPSKWALHYHARLRGMDALNLPTGNQMIGSFCHKIIENLYTENRIWAVEAAVARTKTLFDDCVEQMAAELLEPGRELEKERYRADVCQAVASLIAAIGDAGLHVVDTEAAVGGKTLAGSAFKGYIDLRLEDAAGQTFVIDLKWSGSIKYKKEEIEAGKALQLASYAWLLGKKDTDWAPGAYFMLAQGTLVTSDVQFHARTLISPLSTQEVWNLGEKSWLTHLKHVKSGQIEVSGLLDNDELQASRAEQGLLMEKPPCHFCDFGKLCGKTRAEA